MQQLTVDELVAWCAARADRVTVLDVREPWELARAAFRLDAVAIAHIPMNELPQRLAEIDRAQPVVCLCHHGVRSQQVVAYLSRQGYPAVYNLAGGIDAWSTAIDPAVPRY